MHPELKSIVPFCLRIGHVSPRQALRTLYQVRYWSRLPVLGTISCAFIAKSYQNLPKLTFD